eukprot:TRINITY_DN932_c0_g2_i4.p1 TRINITY_DN932_c0_g2~~TRINITY_DN932_c0_g2_i4.p1  ORF type:complete len:490 (-),score=166.87 TRINITY_DN932_c0_g2_i4:414-1883(-)
MCIRDRKSASKYCEAAEDEIKILKQISGADPEGASQVVLLLDSFAHRGPHGKHVCMVFQVFGPNLLSLIKAYDYKGIPLDIVKTIARQVLAALDFIHTKLDMIHTDLKPENVLLRRHDYQHFVEDAATRYTALKALEFKPPPPAQAKPAEPAPLSKSQKKRLKRKAKQAAAMEEGSKGEGEGVAEKLAEKLAQAALEDPPEAQAPPPSLPEVRKCDLLTLTASTCECKLADLGSACWTHKQFTDDIQTRQYRSPEVIVGSDYGCPADIWSCACMIFELATGDLLFDPRSGKNYSRDEDHLALMMELLGKMPKKLALAGKYSSESFSKKGELKRIKKLNEWPLNKVLSEKYEVEQEEAEAMAQFLLGMLDFHPDRRKTAAESLQDPWLLVQSPDGEVPSSGAAGENENGSVNVNEEKNELSADKLAMMREAARENMKAVAAKMSAEQLAATGAKPQVKASGVRPGSDSEDKGEADLVLGGDDDGCLLGDY